MYSLHTTPSHSTISLMQSDTTIEHEMYADLTDIENIEPEQFQMIMKPNRYKVTKNNNNNTVNFLPQSVTSLLNYNTTDEDIFLYKQGYRKLKKICNTMQGDLYKCEIVKSHKNDKYVAIKRTDKSLLENGIAMEDDVSVMVSESIIKEGLILKYLTKDNQPIGNYIIKYIDFMESDTDYYLVMEYIDSEMNLKEFMSKSLYYINAGKLSINEYHKIMKYLLWQLFVTIQWLHISMNCCHLDICIENVLVNKAEFIERNDGMVSIGTKVSIKLGDFGVSEVFKYNNVSVDNVEKQVSFVCGKQELSLDRVPYLSPKAFSDLLYDASYCDNWSLGILLFECMTLGQYLYTPMTMYGNNSGYYAIHHHQLKEYLIFNDLFKYFDNVSFNLLNSLLNIDDTHRLNGIYILKHKWFSTYFKTYKKQIGKKFDSKNVKINKFFPFYKL